MTCPTVFSTLWPSSCNVPRWVNCSATPPKKPLPPPPCASVAAYTAHKSHANNGCVSSEKASAIATIPAHTPPLPLNEHPRATGLPTILPLPGGEGWGEGELPAFKVTANTFIKNKLHGF